MNQITDVTKNIEHLFRHQAGRITSILTGILGSENFDLAEQSVQEAMIKAMETWPNQGIPHNPEGWLLQVARNKAMDSVRREKIQISGDLEEIERLLESSSNVTPPSEAHLSGELCDDELKMVFMCCHPSIPRDSQVALTLKALCGFEISQIARAFLSKEDTVAQRILRAKNKIADEKIPFVVPPPEEMADRIDAALEAIYLIFNEGYETLAGDTLIRSELCDEAIRLARALTANPRCDSPKVRALLALMLLHSSRAKARTDSEGNIVLLKDQDRSLWDQTLIAEAMAILVSAAEGPVISRYHLEAGIASCHAVAPSEQETAWKQILSYYNQLESLFPSPIVRLNRAIALSHTDGIDGALDELIRLKDEPEMKHYHFYFAALGDFYLKKGNTTEAAENFRRAANLAKNNVEQMFLLKRLNDCTQTAIGNMAIKKEKTNGK